MVDKPLMNCNSVLYAEETSSIEANYQEKWLREANSHSRIPDLQTFWLVSSDMGIVWGFFRVPCPWGLPEIHLLMVYYIQKTNIEAMKLRGSSQHSLCFFLNLPKTVQLLGSILIFTELEVQTFTRIPKGEPQMIP